MMMMSSNNNNNNDSGNDNNNSSDAMTTPTMMDDDTNRANGNDQDNNENKEIKIIMTRKIGITTMAMELTVPNMMDDYGDDDNTIQEQQSDKNKNIDKTI